MRTAITSALVLLLLFTVNAKAASQVAIDKFTLREFNASFAVKKAGLTLGKASFKLKKTGDADWVYASYLAPSGVAKLFIKDTFNESSKVKVADNKIVPQHYYFKRTGSDPENASIVFDWARQQAHVLLDGKTSDRKLINGSQDHYSLVLNLMANAANGVQKADLWVHSKDVEQYHYRQKAKERVSTPSGKYDSIKIVQTNSHNKRELHYWLAPSLNYMPVKIEQYNDGDRILQMVLTAQELLN